VLFDCARLTSSGFTFHRFWEKIDKTPLAHGPFFSFSLISLRIRILGSYIYLPRYWLNNSNVKHTSIRLCHLRKEAFSLRNVVWFCWKWHDARESPCQCGWFYGGQPIVKTLQVIRFLTAVHCYKESELSDIRKTQNVLSSFNKDSLQRHPTTPFFLRPV
jgi:hypothetical protein